VKAASRGPTQPPAAGETKTALRRAASPVPQRSEPEAAPLIVVPLFMLGLLLLGASAVPPRRVRWTAIAHPLNLHRSDLAAIGLGTIALALLWLNIAVLL
jgi:hypothetical protein